MLGSSGSRGNEQREQCDRGDRDGDRRSPTERRYRYAHLGQSLESLGDPGLLQPLERRETLRVGEDQLGALLERRRRAIQVPRHLHRARAAPARQPEARAECDGQGHREGGGRGHAAGEGPAERDRGGDREARTPGAHERPPAHERVDPRAPGLEAHAERSRETSARSVAQRSVARRSSASAVRRPASGSCPAVATVPLLERGVRWRAEIGSAGATALIGPGAHSVSTHSAKSGVSTAGSVDGWNRPRSR